MMYYVQQGTVDIYILRILYICKCYNEYIMQEL